MSTELKPVDRHALTRFWGGEGRGQCVQITERFAKPIQTTQWISVNREQALELAVALIEFAGGTREEDTER